MIVFNKAVQQNRGKMIGYIALIKGAYFLIRFHEGEMSGTGTSVRLQECSFFPVRTTL